MKLPSLRTALIAAVLMLAGWTAGKAQTTAPDFEIVVTTSSTGTSVVKCVRGCNLSWAERGLNPAAKAIGQFEFSCNGGSPCSSGTIGGWLQK